MKTMHETCYPAPLPKHVAIIMDGNGRWAQQRHRPRLFGHKAGADSVREAVETAREIGVRHLTCMLFPRRIGVVPAWRSRAS